MDFIKLIQEGRVDEFKSKYGQKFTPEQLKSITENVPQKFLEWVGKNFDSIEFEKNFQKLVQSLKEFERLSSNLPLTDINSYRNVTELFNALQEYVSRPRRQYRKVDGGNVVYEDDRFFVVNPLTHQASCYYGKGTKWCTAADSSYQFNQYNNDGKLFYILDKSKQTNDPFYKVALLKKFDGDMTYYDSKDETIKGNTWIVGTEQLDELQKAMDSYLESEYAEQLKIWRDKETARKERDRLESLRRRRVLDEREQEAQQRRLDDEWELGPDCPEVGLKAHALLQYLQENEGLNVLDNIDRADMLRIQNEIDELQRRYDEDEDVRTDLLDEIETLEEQLEEYETYMDVYNIIPTGSYYDTTEFEVINAGIEDRRFAVGNDAEMQSSCEEYIDNLIDDIGYEGFNASFARQFIDDEQVANYARDVYEDDVRENPEVYFDESDRMLSDKQDEKIRILKRRIQEINAHIEKLENLYDGENGENDEGIDEKIEELKEMIIEYEDEMEEIESDPQGEYPDDMIDEKVEDLVSDVKRDPEWFMNDFGLDWEDYIDKEGFIKAVVDADGYGHTLNSYDGTADEIYVENTLFYVMRID